MDWQCDSPQVFVVTTTTFKADVAMTSMTLETRAINSREHAIMWETVEVPYDANDL